MAIEYYSSIDLKQNQILRPVIHNSGTISNGSGVKGQLYVHDTQNKLYFHDGTSFIDLTQQGDITGITAGDGLGGSNLTGPVPTLSVNVDDSSIEINSDTLRVKAGGITSAMLSGSIAVGKLAASTITISDGSQSEALSLGDTVTITGTAPIGFAKEGTDAFAISATNATTSAVGVAKFNSSDFAVSGAGDVTIKSGGVSNTQLAGGIANAKLSNSAIIIGGTTTALGGTITALTALTDLDLTAGNKTIFDTVGSNTLTMGAAGTTIAIPGNLTVTGTTTYKNETIQVVADNSLAFRAGDGNSHEIILTAEDATSDKTITLPNTSGTVALTSQITGSNTGTNTGDVTLGGSLDYLTISNQVITRNAINLTTDVTGVLPAANLPDAADNAQGVVELASATEAKNGSGTAKVIDASQLGARSVIATIAASSVNAATNKRALITHSLGTKDIIIEMYDTTTNATVHAEVTRTSNGSTGDDNKITVDFGTAIENDIKVVITSNKGGTGVTPVYA